MARKRKVSAKQADKVRIIGEFLDTEIGKASGILVDCAATHITCIKAAFQNASGFYIMGMEIGTGDKMTFSEIHGVYTACLKDEDFKAYVAGKQAAPVADTEGKPSGNTPEDDKPALNDTNMPSDETEDMIENELDGA